MEFMVNEWVWGGYALLFTFLLIMCILSSVFVIKRKEKTKAVFGVLLGLMFLFSIFLSYWYSYTSDYQPQGRYVMSLLPALTMITANGIKTAEEHKVLKSIVITGMVVYTILYVFCNVYMPSQSGMN